MTIWLCSFWKMFNPGSILHAIWPWNWKVWTKVPKKLLKDKHFLSKLIWSVLRYTMKTLTSRMVWAEIHADSNSDPNVQNTSNCAPMWYRLKRKDIDPWSLTVRHCSVHSCSYPWRPVQNIAKVHSFCKLCLHKDLVFINWQLMSALASLERFGEENLVFINWRSCRHCLQNEWPLREKKYTEMDF